VHTHDKVRGSLPKKKGETDIAIFIHKVNGERVKL
jgi:hypothetical protein